MPKSVHFAVRCCALDQTYLHGVPYLTTRGFEIVSNWLFYALSQVLLYVFNSIKASFKQNDLSLGP